MIRRYVWKTRSGTWAPWSPSLGGAISSPAEADSGYLGWGFKLYSECPSPPVCQRPQVGISSKFSGSCFLFFLFSYATVHLDLPCRLPSASALLGLPLHSGKYSEPHLPALLSPPHSGTQSLPLLTWILTACPSKPNSPWLQVSPISCTPLPQVSFASPPS